MTRAGRWAFGGALIGGLASMLAFAPARWVAWAVHQGSEGRVVLSQAQGTVWAGQARVTLTGGPGSRDALTLPGLLDWRLGWRLGWPVHGGAGGGPAAELALRHTEVMPAPVTLTLQAGIGRWSMALPPRQVAVAAAGATAPKAATGTTGTTVATATTGAAAAALAPQAALMQWPAAWLSALGTPWNTLQPSGLLRLSSPGASLHWAQGRLRLEGALVLEAADMASRLSTLERLGSYRVLVTGAGAGAGAGAEVATVQLSTLEGALQLSGTGQWVGSRFRLRGEARAAPGQEAALQNLLNLIGPRDGARSVLSIG